MNVLPLKGYMAIIAISAVTLSTAHAYYRTPQKNATFTGPYIGLNAGYSLGKSSATTQTPFIPNSYLLTTDTDQVNMAGSNTNLSLDNFTGGIQAGYNYQLDNILLGEKWISIP